MDRPETDYPWNGDMAPAYRVFADGPADLVADSAQIFEGVGEHELKGVPDRWHLNRVVS